MEVVQVPVKKEVFENLKRLAEPLVDDASSVIERLIKHWEKSPPAAANATSQVPGIPAEWRSARGERFPIGAKLRAKYLRHEFEAKVTVNGIEFHDKTYDNPSSAGIAAKKSVGTVGNAANTNGWNFWEMQEPSTKRWISIDVLRAKHRT